jgi:hypothetical protein
VADRLPTSDISLVASDISLAASDMRLATTVSRRCDAGGSASDACYDRFMRRISRRHEGEDVLADAAILQRTMNRLRGEALIPRGVYRFQSHEEADEWMIRTVAATHVRLSSKTSSPSAKR